MSEEAAGWRRGGRPNVVPALGDNGSRDRFLLAALVIALAAVIRLLDLGFPPELYFDETYYANDARLYVEGISAYEQPLDYDAAAPPGQPPPEAALRGERSYPQPPLGKWVLVAGALLTGHMDWIWGYRIMPALFGVGTVLLVYLIAWELTVSVWWSVLAALFAALDGLLIVQSRIAMLDAILAGFVCFGAWCLLRDRRMVIEALPGQRRPWWGTRWRLGAGAAFGAAIATKWPGVLPLAVALGFALGWAIGHGRLRHEVRGIVVALVVIPLLVYVTSYAGLFVQKGVNLSAFWDLQVQILRYHRGDVGSHTYQSDPRGWLVMIRPIAYYFKGETASTGIRHIVALGNPGLWWPFLVGLPALIGVSCLRGRWGERLVAAMFLGQYLPWVVSHMTGGRIQFFYYMTPAVPFMALGLMLALRQLPSRLSVAGAAVVTLAVVAGAAVFFPIWTGYPVSPSHWKRLMVFQSWI